MRERLAFCYRKKIKSDYQKYIMYHSSFMQYRII